jgi:formylglycine-generating enzyme required for sulfatase activity
MKRLALCVAVIVSAFDTAARAEPITHGTTTINVDFVTVGNAGNTGDTQSQGTFGAVDYAYRIGKYEVTAGQYTAFLNAVAATDTYGLYDSRMWSPSYDGCKIQQSGSSGSYTYSVASDWADRPVNYVSLWDAARFANWLHNGQGDGDTETGAYINIGDQDNFARQSGAIFFVPTEDEWYKAAYYDGDSGAYYDYPTGSNSAPGYVNNSGNLSGTGTAFIEGGIDPGNYATYDGDSGMDGIGSPYYRTKVGEWENSESPYGTFDQGGNVWEWNETAIGLLRGLRGGAYNANALLASARGDEFPGGGYYLYGFRVASRVPEPSTLALLGTGALALLVFAWRQRRSA